MLERPVRVLVDEWGLPHIYADRLYDAFIAQGFVAARGRLWQIDLWRKRGLGEMARDFGPAYVEGDRMARAHDRDLAPLWAEGRYFPLAYSREAVERRTRTRLELTPH